MPGRLPWVRAVVVCGELCAVSGARPGPGAGPVQAGSTRSFLTPGRGQQAFPGHCSPWPLGLCWRPPEEWGRLWCVPGPASADPPHPNVFHTPPSKGSSGERLQPPCCVGVQVSVPWCSLLTHSPQGEVAAAHRDGIQVQAAVLGSFSISKDLFTFLSY